MAENESDMSLERAIGRLIEQLGLTDVTRLNVGVVWDSSGAPVVTLQVEQVGKPVSFVELQGRVTLSQFGRASRMLSGYRLVRTDWASPLQPPPEVQARQDAIKAGELKAESSEDSGASPQPD